MVCPAHVLRRCSAREGLGHFRWGQESNSRIGYANIHHYRREFSFVQIPSSADDFLAKCRSVLDNRAVAARFFKRAEYEERAGPARRERKPGGTFAHLEGVSRHVWRRPTQSDF